MAGLNNQEVQALLLRALKPYVLAYCRNPTKASFTVEVSDEYAWGYLTLCVEDENEIGSDLAVKNLLDSAFRQLCQWIDPEVTRSTFGVHINK
jgi:hypothetical protein